MTCTVQCWVMELVHRHLLETRTDSRDKLGPLWSGLMNRWWKTGMCSSYCEVLTPTGQCEVLTPTVPQSTKEQLLFVNLFKEQRWPLGLPLLSTGPVLKTALLSQPGVSFHISDYLSYKLTNQCQPHSSKISK